MLKRRFARNIEVEKPHECVEYVLLVERLRTIQRCKTVQ